MLLRFFYFLKKFSSGSFFFVFPGFGVGDCIVPVAPMDRPHLRLQTERHVFSIFSLNSIRRRDAATAVAASDIRAGYLALVSCQIKKGRGEIGLAEKEQPREQCGPPCCFKLEFCAIYL